MCQQPIRARGILMPYNKGENWSSTFLCLYGPSRTRRPICPYQDQRSSIKKMFIIMAEHFFSIDLCICNVLGFIVVCIMWNIRHMLQMLTLLQCLIFFYISSTDVTLNMLLSLWKRWWNTRVDFVWVWKITAHGHDTASGKSSQPII
jgi:hypothetical protein